MSPLESQARLVKDADDFVEHILDIVGRYQYWHALDQRPTPAQVRNSLREFNRHASALAAWLLRAEMLADITRAEQDALLKINAVAPGARANVAQVQHWLSMAASATARATEALPPKRYVKSAPRIAADALRATFKHHGLKATAYVGGPAVTLLCEIAKAAGDTSMTAAAAKEFIRGKKLGTRSSQKRGD